MSIIYVTHCIVALNRLATVNLYNNCKNLQKMKQIQMSSHQMCNQSGIMLCFEWLARIIDEERRAITSAETRVLDTRFRPRQASQVRTELASFSGDHFIKWLICQTIRVFVNRKNAFFVALSSLELRLTEQTVADSYDELRQAAATENGTHECLMQTGADSYLSIFCEQQTPLCTSIYHNQTLSRPDKGFKVGK